MYLLFLQGSSILPNSSDLLLNSQALRVLASECLRDTPVTSSTADTKPVSAAVSAIQSTFYKSVSFYFGICICAHVFHLCINLYIKCFCRVSAVTIVVIYH
jgi:hypothetical protein